MSNASLYLFDDRRARGWLPFSLTRPVGELLFGCLTLRERAQRAFLTPVSGHLAGSALLGFAEPGAPPVVEPADVPSDGPRIYLSSRAVVERGAIPATDGPCTFTADGQVIGWIVPEGHAALPESALLDPEDFELPGPRVALGALVLEWPWNLVEQNPARISADVTQLQRIGSNLFGLTNVHLVGDHQVSLAPGATLEPGVILDAREGPIRLEEDVYVQAPARLTGPLWVGQGTLLYGGSISHSSIGPVCKVRGEVDASILTSYCNKAHDGYLGHALLGAWVNLGALTTNSDLKNNYSAVRVRLGAEEHDTGLLKVGSFLGDHVKTGIGTLLGTGGVVGAGTNLFGGKMPPSYVPPFCWGAGDELAEYDLEKFLAVTEKAMARRNIAMEPPARALLEGAWRRTRDERA